MQRLTLIPFLIAATGCATVGNFPTYHSHLSLGAAHILTKGVGEIPTLKKGDRVAVVNLNSVLLEDETVPALVEDALVSAIIATGATAVERDSEGLRIAAQEGSGASLEYGARGYTDDPSKPMVVDAELMGARRQVPGNRYLVNGESLVEVPEGTDILETGPGAADDRITRVPMHDEPKLVNQVQTATKLLEYRLIDVSVRNDNAGFGSVIRNVNVVMHLRLVEVDSGLVTWAGFVEDTVSDTIPLRATFSLLATPDAKKPETREATPRAKSKVGEALGKLLGGK